MVRVVACCVLLAGACTSTNPEVELPSHASTSAAAYYPNCDAAREAGAAPLQAGEPGYRSGLDRDGNGEACT